MTAVLASSVHGALYGGPYGIVALAIVVSGLVLLAAQRALTVPRATLIRRRVQSQMTAAERAQRRQAAPGLGELLGLARVWLERRLGETRSWTRVALIVERAGLAAAPGRRDPDRNRGRARAGDDRRARRRRAAPLVPRTHARRLGAVRVRDHEGPQARPRLRRAAPGRPAGSRLVLEGGPQLRPLAAERRRGRPPAGERGVRPRAPGAQARPADRGRARGPRQARPLRAPRLRAHRRDDPARGRRQPGRALRDGRRDGARAPAARAEAAQPDGDGTDVGGRARLSPLRRGDRPDRDQPGLHAPAVCDVGRPDDDPRRLRDDRRSARLILRRIVSPPR